MPVEKFKEIVSEVVLLPADNVDTDQIIPARFLKATERNGFGDKLFHDWRYNADGSPNENFVLNKAVSRGLILAAGRNFGSGSSREHAAWALYDYGFRVVISSFFADIFRNNALNTGLLPVQVPEVFMDRLFTTAETNSAVRVRVDLEKQIVTILPEGYEAGFGISSYKKECLLNGFDDVDFLLSRKPSIEKWEAARHPEAERNQESTDEMIVEMNQEGESKPESAEEWKADLKSKTGSNQESTKEMRAEGKPEAGKNPASSGELRTDREPEAGRENGVR